MFLLDQWTGAICEEETGETVVRRWTTMQIAVAMLALLALAGAFVFSREAAPPAAPRVALAEPTYESDLLSAPEFGRAGGTPAQTSLDVPALAPRNLTAHTGIPAMETLLRWDPSMLAVPAATTWTDLSLSVQKVDPGAPFTTDQPWYVVVGGPQVLMLLDGALDLQVDGPALFYPAGDVDQPRAIQPGDLLHLAPRDAVVYDSKDGASGKSSGERQMVALVGLAGRADPSLPRSILFPAKIDIEALDVRSSPLGVTSDAATVSLQRLRLAPLEPVVFDPDPGWRYLVTFDPLRTQELRVFAGAMDEFELSAGHASWNVQTLEDGPHTFVNFGEEPVDLYFMVVEEDSDAGIPPN